MTYTFPPEKSSSHTVSDTRLGCLDAARAHWRCSRSLMDDEMFAERVNTAASLVLPSEDKSPKAFEAGDDKLLCHAGQSSYWITWDGRMLPCVNFGNIAAYPLKSGFKKAWEQITADTAEKVRFPKKCATCAIKKSCIACPAYFYTETGKADVFYEDICNFTENFVMCARKLKEGKNIDEL